MAGGTSEARVAAYEELLNEQLRGELERVLDRRDRIYERIAACLELQNSMKRLKEDQRTSFRSLIDLGCDFYMQAEVADTSFVFVSVGLGFHAQMTVDEAIEFATAREKQLSESTEVLTQHVAQLKARIKLVIGAIDELTSSSQNSAKS